MVRKLKLHEKKLLKKTDFMQWEVDHYGKQTKQMRRYHIFKREHYSLYNKLAAQVRSIAEKLKELPVNEPFRVRCVKEMLSKLYAAGIIPTADTAERLGQVSAASFARRRLPVVMRKIGMVDSIRGASDFVEQGHVRIGPKLVTDPAFMVTRAQEDAITWTNTSKIKMHVLNYNNTRDDFDLA
ncbi:S4 domain protein [Dictyocaulus viviparus]|uniref:U3 small nucleolar ribonucleoprotein protein IMP3 n=1 Tax=Dictyocaulus viviparus TaxID=29172 RepID=A0A0D8XJY6_DICVI|nr:S4 domain protein [Dictyocaulus viviparus]